MHFRICWFSIECLVMWVRSINRYFTINFSHFQKQPILPYYYFNQYKIQSEFLNNRHNVCTLKGPWLCWSFVLSEGFNCLFSFCSFIHCLMIISTILRIIAFTTNQCLIDTKIKTIHLWVRTKQKSINKFCDDGLHKNYAILFAQLAITVDCV